MNINYKILLISAICLALALTIQCSRQGSSGKNDKNADEAYDDADYDGNDSYTEIMAEGKDVDEMEPVEKTQDIKTDKAKIETEIDSLISQIDGTIEEIDKNIENTHGDIKDNFEKTKDELKVERQKMEGRLKKVRESSDQDWQQIKSNTLGAFKDLKIKLKQAAEDLEEV